MASLVTAQEITDEEIDRARGLNIEVRAGTSKSTAKLITVTRTREECQAKHKAKKRAAEVEERS